MEKENDSLYLTAQDDFMEVENCLPSNEEIVTNLAVNENVLPVMKEKVTNPTVPVPVILPTRTVYEVKNNIVDKKPTAKDIIQELKESRLEAEKTMTVDSFSLSVHFATQHAPFRRERQVKIVCNDSDSLNS